MPIEPVSSGADESTVRNSDAALCAPSAAVSLHFSQMAIS